MEEITKKKSFNNSFNAKKSSAFFDEQSKKGSVILDDICDSNRYREKNDRHGESLERVVVKTGKKFMDGNREIINSMKKRYNVS